MGAKAAGQFPYPFDAVQFRAVRRKEVEAQDKPLFVKPRDQGSGVVIWRIIQDHEEPATATTVIDELHQKLLERSGVERGFPPCDQPSIRDRNGSKDTYALSSRG